MGASLSYCTQNFLPPVCSLWSLNGNTVLSAGMSRLRSECGAALGALALCLFVVLMFLQASDQPQQAPLLLSRPGRGAAPQNFQDVPLIRSPAAADVVPPARKGVAAGRGIAIGTNSRGKHALLLAFEKPLQHAPQPWIMTGADENAGEGSDKRADAKIKASFRGSYEGGVRSFDTASHYRGQQCERMLAEGLEGYPRESYIITTKCGSAPKDQKSGLKASLVVAEWSRTYNFSLQDDVYMVPSTRQRWSLHPEYLRAQLDTSLRNLRTDYVDVMLLHSLSKYPQGTGKLAWNDVLGLLAPTFEYMETERKRGRIRLYGFSNPTTQYDSAGVFADPDAAWSVQLEALVTIAKASAARAGTVSMDHGFRVVMAACNEAQPACLTKMSQVVEGEKMSLVQAVRRLGLHLMSLSATAQATLATSSCTKAALRAMGWSLTDRTAAVSSSLQVTRSMIASAGSASATVCHTTPSHLASNLRVAQQRLLSAIELESCLGMPVFPG